VLKNKEEINIFENLCSFKVAEASDLISRLDFLLHNLFLCFGHCTYRQCSTGIPMGTNCAIYLANFYLFSSEFDFLNCLFKNNACRTVLHRLYLVCRIVDDLFVADFPNFLFSYHDYSSFSLHCLVHSSASLASILIELCFCSLHPFYQPVSSASVALFHVFGIGRIVCLSSGISLRIYPY